MCNCSLKLTNQVSHVYYTKQDICNFFIGTKYFPKEIVPLIFIGFYQLILYIYF